MNQKRCDLEYVMEFYLNSDSDQEFNSDREYYLYFWVKIKNRNYSELVN